MSEQTRILPRKAVQALHAYLPPLEGRRSRIRLDFNENTAPLIDLIQAQCFQSDLAQEVSIYPEYSQLMATLAETLAIPQASLLLTNGSDEGISVVASTFIEPKEDVALTVSPTFALIPHSLKLAESILFEIPYTTDWKYDIEAIETALAQEWVKLAVFATPDNPTGALLSIDVVARWSAKFPQTLFLLDEAYAEYVVQSGGQSSQDSIELALSTHNVLVSRTFSKAWGLAGLRLGMVIGHPDLMTELSKVRSPYSVNAAAVAAVLVLLPQRDEILSHAQSVMVHKAKLLDILREQGYLIVEGAANFWMMYFGLAAPAFCAFCLEHGILVRDRSSMHPTLQGWVRVSMGTGDEMIHFLSVLNSYASRQAVIFDMDGTLVDTSASFDAVVGLMVEQYTGKPMAIAELNALRVEGGFNDDWEAATELIQRRGVAASYEEIAEKALAHYLSIAPTVESWLLEPDCLTQLACRYRIAVATGRSRVEFDQVWKERFARYFDVVICQDDVADTGKKPSPDLLLLAKEKLGATGGYYVGNSVDDMHAATAAGLLPIGVSTTLSREDLLKANASWVYQTPQEAIIQFITPPSLKK